MGSLIVLLVFYCAISGNDFAGAGNVKQRVRVIESRLNLLDQGVYSYTDSIAKLNETVMDLVEQCSSDGTEMESQSSDTNKGSVKIEDNGVHDKYEHVLRAFTQEKRYIRNFEHHMNAALAGFKKNMSNAVAKENTTMYTMIEHLATSFDNLQADLNASMKALQKSTADDIKSLRSYIDTSHELQKIKTTDATESLKTYFETVTAKQTDFLKTMVNEIKINMSRVNEPVNMSCVNEPVKACLRDWTKYKGSLYNYFTERLSFADAKMACASCYSNLMDVQDEDEMTFVMDLMGPLTGSHAATTFWLGATDAANENTWIWDRTKEEATYTNWREGQPNGRNQHCLVAGYYKPYDLWNDLNCGGEYHYVCKYKQAEE